VWKTATRVTHAVLAGDVLVLAAPNVLVAVDPATGTERWRREVSGIARALDAAQGQVLVLLQDSGAAARARFLSVDAITSDVLWSHEMPTESPEGLLVGEEAAVVLRRRRTTGAVACSVHSLLTGAVVRDLALSGSYLEPILRLADPHTLVVGIREGGATRVDAYDLPAATPRWTRSLADPQGRVVHLVPAGDVIVALDAAGGLRDLSLADGSVVHETKIVGGVDVVVGTQPFVDATRVVLMQNGPAPSLEAFDRDTGRAAWRVPLQGRANGGLLLHSGNLFVALVAPRRTQNRLGAAMPTPGSLQAWFVNAADGASLGELSSPSLGSWMPSAVLSDGALVVVGVDALAVYR
jgi:outer membrane protein assembly factor BamB